MKEDESSILRANKRQCRHPWPLGVSHCQQQFWSKFPHKNCHRQCSVHCYTSLFSDGVINYTWLPMCLGPSRPARKGEISLVPRNLEAVGRGRRNRSDLSNWFTGPPEPEDEGKGNKYTTCSAIENGFLPYKMALVMLITVPGLQAYWSQVSVLSIPSTEGTTGWYFL